MTRADRIIVRLTGIVLRQQGTHDSLCAYYSAAMMLCALRPELEEQFDAPHVGLDPLYANLPRRAGRTLERSVTDWLTSGVQLQDLCRSLNRACAGKTRFRFRKGKITVEELRAHVDLGLPCVLGWESREMGNHTSLVVGYEKFAGSKSRWLRLLDPIRAQENLEWGQLCDLATAPLELVYCESHDGIRPDKLTVHKKNGSILKTRLDRWDPSRRSWNAMNV